MDTKTALDTLFSDQTEYSDNAARQSAFRTAIAGYDVDLGELETAAVKRFEVLRGQDNAKPGALGELRKIADGVTAIREVRKQAPAPAAANAPAAPAAQPGTATTTTPPQEAPQMTTAPTAPGTEVVAASGTTVTLQQPSDLSWHSMPFDLEAAGSTYTITAAAGGPGVEAGETFKDMGKLTSLLAAKFENLARGLSEPSQMMMASARPEDWATTYSNISRSMIASLAFSRKHDFVMKHQHDWQVIEEACNESRLPGGSLTPRTSGSTALTAAPGTPGWCAPCEVRYDFCPPAVLDGIVDLPTVIAARGCLTFPTMPDFGELYAGTGFCYPASDYDLTTPPAGTPAGGPWAKNKPCMMVPCPETQTCTLDPCGVCLQSSILVERAYPELIQYFIANSLVAWGHRMNCRDLSQMIAKSRKVPVTGAVAGDSYNAATGPGATSSILEVIDFYATWLRYKYRLGVNASIEVVLPEWARGVIRADLSKRMGIDLLSVTDAMIDGYLLIRKVRVQWVLGLDEAFCDVQGTPPAQVDPATSAKFGGDYALGAAAVTGPPAVPAVPPALWPETVSFLMYPAGTFFRARMNLVNIEGGLVDSALLKRNERLLLFVEEASVVCKRCYDSLYITVDICASGQTGGGSTTHPACVTAGP